MFRNRVSCNLWNKAFLNAIPMPAHALAKEVGVAEIVAFFFMNEYMRGVPSCNSCNWKCK